jgi:hypothetical protein
MFGIDEFPSSGETGSYNALNAASGFATSAGEGLVDSSSTLMNALLSGNSADISKLLAPQISTLQKQGQQQIQTSSQFGNRSGGTNAANQNVIDSTRANVSDMTAQLTGGALNSSASLGSSLLSQGMSGYGTSFGEAKTMQDQKASAWGDIFKSISSVAGGVVSGLPGSPGSAQDWGSNALAGFN